MTDAFVNHVTESRLLASGVAMHSAVRLGFLKQYEILWPSHIIADCRLYVPGRSLVSKLENKKKNSICFILLLFLLQRMVFVAPTLKIQRVHVCCPLILYSSLRFLCLCHIQSPTLSSWYPWALNGGLVSVATAMQMMADYDKRSEMHVVCYKLPISCRPRIRSWLFFSAYIYHDLPASFHGETII